MSTDSSQDIANELRTHVAAIHNQTGFSLLAIAMSRAADSLEIQESTIKTLTIEQRKRDARVMASVRQLIKAKKKASNGRLAAELFGTGYDESRTLCVELGLDPNGQETDYDEMINYLAKNN